MYYINKIVGWVLSPLGILFLGLASFWLLGRFTGWAKGPRVSRALFWLKAKRRWIVGVALVQLWVLSCGITTRLIGVPLELDESQQCDPAALVKEGAPIDAIVLLGGGMGAHEKCGRPEMFSGADRVWEAARVWKGMGQSLPVFCTGGGVVESTLPLLVDLGVPREVVRTVPDARNTEEEAKLMKAELGETPRIVLVTSAWHMPRARGLFERAGFEVVPAPTDFEMQYAAEHPVEFGDFFPNAESLLRNSWAVKEWVARFGYWVFRR